MRKNVILPVLLSLLFVCGPLLCRSAADELFKGISGDIGASRTIVVKAMAKLQSGEPAVAEVAALHRLAESIRAAHLLMGERLKERSAKVAALGARAAERQEVAATAYAKAIDDYLALVGALSPDGMAALETLASLKELLDRLSPPKKRPIHGTLPYRQTAYAPGEPAVSPTVIPAYRGGDRTVTAADTAATAAAPHSAAIVALAQELQWNPVLIYEWVKNCVATEWYYGSMKGAEETLRQRSGNDADQASLLIALLRAAGYPSRYVKGVIEFFPDVDKAKNLTGISDPLQILIFLRKAGIPCQPVIAGGTIVNIRLEHVWVESEIPYANSRGAINDGMGKTWLGLDTGIKPRGIAWNSSQELPAGFFATLRDDYLQTVPTSTPLEFVRARVEEHLRQNSPATAYQQLLSQSEIIPDILKILPASLQFKTIAITGEYTELPIQLNHKLTITATAGVSELFSTTLETHTLANKKIALRAEPETVEDQNLIDSFGGLDNTPAYLVRLRPVLTLDGERIIVARDGLPMGGDFSLDIDIVTPNGSERITSTQINGNLAVIGVASQKATTPAAISEEYDAETILHKEAVGYIHRWNQGEEDLAALLGQRIIRPTVTIAIAGNQLDVTTLLDTPHGLEWQGVYLDAAYRRIALSGNSQKQLLQLSGLEGSVLEHRLFEDDLNVESVSTAKLLQQAKADNVPILSIDITNVDTLLPTLPFDQTVRDDIANAVNRNLIVTIPQSEITYRDWSGIGYLKEHPESGEAGWMLSGGIAGGMTVWLPDKWDATAALAMSAKLRAPYSGKPITDPLPAATIVKIPATDYQVGTVGKPVGKLQVKVRDALSRPVAKANVTFKILAGGGKLNSASAQVVTQTTDSNGIASVSLTLGEQTALNPVYLVAEGKTIANQYGGNLIDARLDNGAAVTTPFIILSRPGPPDHLRKTHGDGVKGLIHSFAGFVGLILEDSFGNPIANQPVSFTIGAATGAPVCNKDTTPAKLVETTDPCIGSSPTTADVCASAKKTINATFAPEGAAVEVILGGAPSAGYKVVAATTAKNAAGQAIAPAEFNLATLPFGDCVIDAAPKAVLFTTYVTPTDVAGRSIDAGRSGSTITLKAREYLIKEGERQVDQAISCSGSTLTCPQIFGSHAYSVVTKPEAGNILFNGAPGIDKGNGIYEIPYVLGPGPNLIRIDGQAVYKYRESANSCSSGCQMLDKLETLTATAWLKVYGVDISVKQSLKIMLDDSNRSRNSLRIPFAIAPVDYKAYSANIFLYKATSSAGKTAEELIDYIPTESKGKGYGVLAKGYQFEPEKEYRVQLVLNYGTGEEVRSDMTPITFALGALVPDYDHSRRIEDSDDLDRALNDDTYYFWVNDDDGSGDTEGTGIPASGRVNGTIMYSTYISGTRDLIDFFPVHMDIAKLKVKYPPSAYTYKLHHETNSLSIVETALTAQTSGNYLTDIETAKALANAPKQAINAAGYTLPNSILSGNGIVLIEGWQETTKPLKLAVYDGSGNKKEELQQQLSIAGVEQMFRHKNLMMEMHRIEELFPGIIPPAGVLPVAGHPVPNEGLPDRLTVGDFSNSSHFTRFDKDSDDFDAETGKKNDFIHVHGYNVNGQDARGEQAEVFKRLYWSGSRARFWGVTWYGWDSQKDILDIALGIPTGRKRSSNYHVNIRHAFNAGKLLKNFVNSNSLLKNGNATISAHSLGNMVVSTAIQESMSYGKYLMLDAAVAEEAYINLEPYENNWVESTRALMYSPDWQYPKGTDTSYKPFLWQSEWYKLFKDNTNDARNTLTWRNNFSSVRNSNVYAYYATTDEAFRPFKLSLDDVASATSPNDPKYDGAKSKGSYMWTLIWNYLNLWDPEQVGTYAYSYNELMKGTEINPYSLTTDSMYGGWGFNTNVNDGHYISCIDPVGDCGQMKPDEANKLASNSALLKTKPFFNKNPDNSSLFTNNFVSSSVLTTAMRERMLANEIPALTFAVGHMGVINSPQINNVNIRDRFLINFRVPWPRGTPLTPEWRHSDFINVGYPYLYRLYDDFVLKSK